jgi:lysyl-tRNA synthetase class 2
METGTGSWQPGIDIDRLRLRARVLENIRHFFSVRDVLEVETPVLSAAATTDPAIESFITRYEGPGVSRPVTLYLQTSPEFFMKRLLSAGSGAIYQLGRVFRNAEFGRSHNPEFLMLEWYRPGFSLAGLMEEVAELVTCLLAIGGKQVQRLDFSYLQVFEKFAGIDPHAADGQALLETVNRHGINAPLDAQDEKDVILDFMMTHIIEPALPTDRLVFIRDFPASQASLARIEPGQPDLAKRFEVYLGGRELANGFEELQDAEEQRQRFDNDARTRRERGQLPVPIDKHLLSALEHGLPSCSGVALGIERLLMFLFDVDSLSGTMSFDFGHL